MQRSAILKLRINIMLLTLAVLVMTLAFNLVLSASALNSLARESILSGYRSYGGRLANDIERGIRFGKPLDSFAGMDKMLEGFLYGASGIGYVEVADTDGKQLYSQTRQGLNNKKNLKENTPLETDKSEGSIFEISDGVQKTPAGYLIKIRLEHKKATAGWIAIEVANKMVDAGVKSFLGWSYLLLPAACLIAGLILTGWLTLFTSSVDYRANLHSSLSKLLLIIIGGTQLAYACGTLVLFNSFVEQAVRKKAGILAQAVERDFEYLLQKDLDVTRLHGKQQLLQKLVDGNEELQGAQLLRPDGTVLSSAGDAVAKGAPVVEESIDIYWPSRFRRQEEILRLRLSITSDFISSQIIKLGINLATSLVISLLLLLELAKLLELIALRTLGKAIKAGGQKLALNLPNAARAIRGAGFVYFFGYDMGISFIPLLARKLYQPMWGLSEQVVIGLPISAEMVSAGIALLISGGFSKKYGWRKTFILGTLSAATGLTLGWLASDLPMLILSRLTAGFGFGLVLMAAQIGTLGDEQAGAGLASVFAGIFSGSICGSATGALLAEHVSYATVLFTGAVTVIFAMPVCMLTKFSAGTVGTRPEITARAQSEPTVSASVFSIFSGSGGLLKDTRVYWLLLCIGIPASLCLTGFLQYLLPLFLNAAHVEQSNIGRVFMVYGLCFITIGPVIGRLIDKATDKTMFPMLAGMFSGGSLLIAAAAPGLYGMTVAVLALGVAQTMAIPATMLCILSLRSAKILGQEKTASIYRALERLGQVLGPVLFGVAIAVVDTKHALFIMGGSICIVSILFKGIWPAIGSRR